MTHLTKIVMFLAVYLFENALCDHDEFSHFVSLNDSNKDYSCAQLTTEDECLHIPPFHTGNDAFSQILDFNYTCSWNGTYCKRVICSHIGSESECNQYSGQDYNYICNWGTTGLISTDPDREDKNTNDNNESISVCYNNCAHKYQIVIAIDASLSVIDVNQGGDPDNRKNEMNVVLDILSFVWHLAELQNIGNDNNGPNVLFSLITYNTDVTVHFDLVNNNFTTLDDYSDKISDIFNNLVYLDDTATSPAILEAYNVFNQSKNVLSDDDSDDDEWTRIFGVITLGQANMPPTASSPCSEIYNFNQLFSDLGVLFHTLMIGFDDRESFKCLTDASLFANIEFINTFNDIINNHERIGSLFQSKVCDNGNKNGINTNDSDEDDNDNKKNNNSINFLLWIIIAAAVIGCLLFWLIVGVLAAQKKKKATSNAAKKPEGVSEESKTMIGTEP